MKRKKKRLKKMKFLPQIKVYEVDYQFIIDNYTSPELWDKVWNLFVFKNYVYNLGIKEDILMK